MSRVFTADEVKKHNTRKSVWMVIRNDVYDVTSFLEEHPGGEEPLMEAGGQDATIAFDDVGHSPDAKSMLSKYKIGSLAPGQGCCKMKPKVWRSSSSFESDEKPWLRFSPTTVSPRPSPTKSMKSRFSVPDSPTAERRVQQIIVPREPRRRGPPCGGGRRPPRPPPSSSKLKWALLALGIAIVIGIAYKKYSG